MWILIILFLFLPLVTYQELSNRQIQNTPDYVLQDSTPEMAQFAAYTTAVRTKTSLGNRDETDYWDSWSDETLEEYKSSPVLKFPRSAHGNCVSRNQTITVQTTQPTSATNPALATRSKQTSFRVAWITPRSADWKKDTKYYNERFFGMYDGTSKTIRTKGSFANIRLCDQMAPNQDAFIFAIEQKQ